MFAVRVRMRSSRIRNENAGQSALAQLRIYACKIYMYVGVVSVAKNPQNRKQVPFRHHNTHITTYIIAADNNSNSFNDTTKCLLAQLTRSTTQNAWRNRVRHRVVASAAASLS